MPGVNSKFSNTNKRQRVEESDEVVELTHDFLVKELSRIAHSCKTKGLCCLYDTLSSSGSNPSADKACELIKRCRSFVAPMSTEEENLFLAEDFNSSIRNFSNV
jgi:hypothetical protein